MRRHPQAIHPCAERKQSGRPIRDRAYKWNEVLDREGLRSHANSAVVEFLGEGAGPHALSGDEAETVSDIEPRTAQDPADAGGKSIFHNGRSHRRQRRGWHRAVLIHIAAGSNEAFTQPPLNCATERVLIVPIERDGVLESVRIQEAVYARVRSIRKTDRQAGETVLPVRPGRLRTRNAATGSSARPR